MLEKRLPIPAYDLLLKCSHAFNIMDARGAVGVTERADCFATMRALAREVTGGLLLTVLWLSPRSNFLQTLQGLEVACTAVACDICHNK